MARKITMAPAEDDNTPPANPGITAAPGLVDGADVDGVAPQDEAPVWEKPDFIKRHFLKQFPHLRPRPHPTNKGMWMNRDGSQYNPRVRRGGQFSAMYLTAASAAFPDDPQYQRKIILPMGVKDKIEDYLRSHETYTQCVELVFDFEDQMVSFLKGHGVDPTKDPERQKMEKDKNFAWAAGALDSADPKTTAGMALAVE